ncbi:uncharacterized protein si:dkeyp-97a10.3 isoform X2 [Betta splendens]|uniref:Uncharacterized protein si:dkeyp-97a10.3 isoform X2 n=1 Tax=Betta splendens TaxID=158456 RepID=A0A6P7KV03_BETSP|nr:uncharacterized protein si:dkeyp-97a10.3 isoform X2 [Betta splendens]
MTRPLLLLRVTLAALLWAEVPAQAPVSVQFQTDPVVVQTGTNAVFTVVTVPQVLSMTWFYKGVTLGVWAGGAAVVNPVPQFLGRISITATQLQITGAQLQDAGNYTVTVTPIGTAALANSKSAQLGVFDPVNGVTLVASSVAVEGRNVSLSCTWTSGTNVIVQWGLNGAAVAASARISISGGSLVINPAQRADAGAYTCTASNPVSAQTASLTLTVYYGPDTPALTKQSPNQNAGACVGGGDVVAGQTVALTCASSSLPPAVYTWRFNGQPLTSSQSAGGVLALQTYSTNQSGQYFCTATNSVSGNTSTQGTVLAVVGTCLTVGQVVGIVIGSLLMLVIIVLLIVLIVFFSRRRRAPRREGGAVVVQKTNPQSRPPDPQPNGVREMGQGPDPPLFYTQRPERDAARSGRGTEAQTPRLSRLQNPDTNRLLNHQSSGSEPLNGADNPAFERTPQQQNPNIVIQTGSAPDGGRLQAVHLNLNTPPHAAQHNSGAQMPTIHVNLTSLASGGETQRDAALPPANAAHNRAPPNPVNTQQSLPREQSRQLHPSDHRLNGHVDTGNQLQPGLIPTGYTHDNSHSPSQRNANTQTYQQDAHPSRSDRTAGPRDDASRQQMSWDLLRGTPAYPRGAPQRGRAPQDSDSTDYTDYTSHPPIREAGITNTTRPRGQTRSRTPATQDAASADRRTRSRSADSRDPDHLSVAEIMAPVHAQRIHNTQRERAQRDIRGLSGSQAAPRQEATRSNNPQALPLTSRQASVDRPAVSQAPTEPRGLNSSRGTDNRALADPNHLPQTHVSQQHRAAWSRTPPQGLSSATQPVARDARQPLQRAPAAIPQASSQSNPSNLTQAALEAHTKTAQTFQNRRQQTQAALLHPGPQAPVATVQQPPKPPPVIPLAEFRTLPKEREEHRPSRPPANVPLAQRPNGQHHPGTHRHHAGWVPAHAGANRNTHEHPGQGHPGHGPGLRGHPGHPGHGHQGQRRQGHQGQGHPGQGHPGHFPHHQQQARRGRPR